jgi:hypothetical protein
MSRLKWCPRGCGKKLLFVDKTYKCKDCGRIIAKTKEELNKVYKKMGW